MIKRRDLIRFLLAITIALIFQSLTSAIDTLNLTHSISDGGETLISPGGKFEMGFFSPGNSRNRYLGMWFRNIAVRTYVWVANRDYPLTDYSGVLRVTDPGILALVNGTNGTIVWSSNTSRPLQDPVAQFLSSGNLVVRDRNDGPENIVWQSFDYPTDTYLPGMKLGKNLVTNHETYLSSWRSNDDPGTGGFSFRVDPTGYPQILVKRGQAVQSRIGPWNGILFPGPPSLHEENRFRVTLEMDETKVYYGANIIDESFISKYVINQSGISERWNWVDRTQEWIIYFNLPSDLCDTYRLCGAYGRCDRDSSPACECLDRFVPRDPDGWARADSTNGCIRRANLSCQSDIFLKYSGVKLPDARNSRHNASMTLQECRDECLRDCSCMAYTQLDIRTRTGCLIWNDELVDIRTLSRDGQDLYIRMASSESDSGRKTREILVASLTTALGFVLICLSLFLYIRKRKNNLKTRNKGTFNGRSQGNDSDLPFFDLAVVQKATDNFSDKNKLGEGGFGPVYKGMLGGQEIAVKRLSKDSRQGRDELTNEIIFIAKLQHRNLVKLIGCCIKGDESMLVYEYMPNKSLDVILFDKTKCALLDWQKRFHIINGVARGLLYLHQDSRLRIIHRDLKASNILLDSEMNPKISDFGLARSFGGNETGARTRHVVGTYGYMAPEYAVDGLFSVKSDVFSFGVLVLEIVSGKRNRGYAHGEHSLNLLGHAWTLYKEGRWQELVDTCLDEKIYSSEVFRSIQVGLLCVQQKTEDRPNMSNVVLMLGNEGEIPEAKHPGFFTERDVIASLGSCKTKPANSANEVTITMPEPR